MPSVQDPAAFGAIPLLDESGCGGAFVLDSEPSRGGVADAGDGWRVEVRAGVPAVVARGPGAGSATEAHSLAADAAQRGLDLFSVRGRGDLLIRLAEEENLAWWTEGDRRTLRVTAHSPIRMSVGEVTGIVTDPSGVERPHPPPAPEPNWHASFRHFRLAQVSEEVFDAYRNLYLALESVLSTSTPLEAGERDYDWFKRALSAAADAGLNLAGYAPAGVEDPAEAIRSDLFSEVRTATFHAKEGKRTLLSLDSVDRRRVLDSLSRLARLYLELANRTLGVRRPGGGFFKGGFDMMIGDMARQLEVHVTDDPGPCDASDTVINPSGGRVVHLATRPSPEYDEPFLATILGQTAVENLHELTHVSRVASVTPSGDPVAAGNLEARLTLGGFDVLEVLMGVRGINVQQPRSRYPA